MSSRILTGLLMAFVCATGLQAQGQMVVRVTAERTSVRETPATDAAVVTTVVKGDELDVLETSGAWYRVRVRSTSREGFVHSLFVERTAGATTAPAASPASAAAPAAGPQAASQGSPAAARPATSAASQPPRPAGSSSQPFSPSSGSPLEHHLGLGLTTGGLAFGFTPSMRFWSDGKIGMEVNASFLHSYGTSVTALSPSVLVKIGDESRRAGPVSISPYWGAGLTYWHYSNDFLDYYCRTGIADCSTSALGFGGFGGAEFSFDAIPKLSASANVGFYSSPAALGYGGLYFSIAGHWYFK
jgi:Bacterial SH3 domain